MKAYSILCASRKNAKATKISLGQNKGYKNAFFFHFVSSNSLQFDF